MNKHHYTLEKWSPPPSLTLFERLLFVLPLTGYAIRLVRVVQQSGWKYKHEFYGEFQDQCQGTTAVELPCYLLTSAKIAVLKLFFHWRKCQRKKRRFRWNFASLTAAFMQQNFLPKLEKPNLLKTYPSQHVQVPPILFPYKIATRTFRTLFHKTTATFCGVPTRITWLHLIMTHGKLLRGATGSQRQQLQQERALSPCVVCPCCCWVDALDRGNDLVHEPDVFAGSESGDGPEAAVIGMEHWRVRAAPAESCSQFHPEKVTEKGGNSAFRRGSCTLSALASIWAVSESLELGRLLLGLLSGFFPLPPNREDWGGFRGWV